MFHRIVVPLDGSGFGDHAIRYATSIARPAGAAIELVHVHVPEHLEGDPFTLTPYRFQGVVRFEADYDYGKIEREAEVLDRRARRLADETGLPVTSRILAGRVDQAVESEAEDFRADLIVMATHARSGYARVRLGSVGDAVIRIATMPVLFVQPQNDLPQLAPRFESILVALDGSGFSEQVLPHAIGLAKLFDSRISLFHVPPDRPGRRHYNDRRWHAELSARLRDGEDYLRRIARRIEDAAPRLDMVVATKDEPASAIMYAAQDANADIVAMATHGRGGVSRLMFGSTTDLVLRLSTRPLLVSRPTPVPVNIEGAPTLVGLTV